MTGPRLEAKAAIAWLLVVVAFPALSPASEINLKPGIIGADDRRPIDNNKPPWTAIGQVNIGGYRMRGMCTGALIAPRVVLTSAHCVHDRVKKIPFLLKDIHFVAGVHGGKSLGQSVARCLKFPPGFHYTGPDRVFPDLPFQKVPAASFKLDLAVIVLADDIPKAGTMDILGHDSLAAGTSLTHAAYPIDRRFMLTAHTGCKVIERNADLVATDCDTHFGSSGGPVLASDADGTMKLAGVMSGIDINRATLVVPLPVWPALPLTAECP